MRLEFTVPGKPVPWQRAASRGRQRFTSPKHRAYKTKVGYAALAARPKGWPLDARYAVRITAYTTRRPDLDNIAKMVLDSIIGVLLSDDRRVDALSIVRVAGVGPGALVVSVRVMSEDELIDAERAA